MRRILCIVAIVFLLAPFSTFAASGTLPWDTGGLIPPDDSDSGWNIGDPDGDTDIYYRAGDKDSDGGTDISDLQHALIALGYLNGSADGQYGKGTAKAVKEYQHAKNYEATGQVTYDQYWEILDAAETKQEEPDTQGIIDQINRIKDEQVLQAISEAVASRIEAIGNSN